jgi:hypothetical protein
MPHRVRDGMRITWHQPITVDDGLVCAPTCTAPSRTIRVPVILNYGIYAKGLAYQDGYPLQWEKMVADYPEILRPRPNKYQNWETTDPERWVPHGYAIVRVDSRGAGWSPGFMDPGGPREIAGSLPMHRMGGHAAVEQRQGRHARHLVLREQPVARGGLHPPHLAAIIPWEGQNDRYRDSGYHGGILCQFQERWAKHQVANIQYGRGERAKKNPNTGESVAGPVTLSDEELAKNRVDAFEELKKHPLRRPGTARAPPISRSCERRCSPARTGRPGHTPARELSTATRDARRHAEVARGHGDSHWSLFSSDYGLDLQKRFFDHFLKGEKNGWDKQPRCSSTSAIPASASCGATRTSGRSRARNGRSSISIQRDRL